MSIDSKPDYQEDEDDEPRKRCPMCGVRKPLSAFGRNKSRADGHDALCAEDRRIYSRLYQQNNRGHIRRARKAWEQRLAKKKEQAQAAHDAKPGPPPDPQMHKQLRREKEERFRARHPSAFKASQYRADLRARDARAQQQVRPAALIVCVPASEDWEGHGIPTCWRVLDADDRGGAVLHTCPDRWEAVAWAEEQGRVVLAIELVGLS